MTKPTKTHRRILYIVTLLMAYLSSTVSVARSQSVTASDTGQIAAAARIPITAANANQVNKRKPSVPLITEGTAVAYSPDGSQLAVGEANGTIMIYKLPSVGSAIQLGGGLKQRINHMAFNHKGDLLAVAMDNGSVRIWDISIKKSLVGYHEHSDTAGNIAFSDDDKRLISVGKAPSVIIMITKGEPQEYIDAESTYYDIAFSPTEDVIAIPLDSGSVATLNATTGDNVAQYEIGDSIHHPLTSVAYSPDGSQLIASDYKGQIFIWDVKTKELIKTEFEDQRLTSLPLIRLNIDGSVLAMVGQDSVVRLWDIKTGVLLNYLDDHTAKVNDIAFSPDGTQFATVGKDKQLLVWEVAARPLYRTSEALRGAVYMANSIAGLRDAVPQTWVAKSEESARYSVTIEQKSSSIIQGCSYSEGHTLQRVLSKVDITVTEIAKKRIVARTTLSGEPPIVCPDVYSFSKPIEQTVGPNPDVTAVISWLRRTLPALAAKK